MARDLLQIHRGNKFDLPNLTQGELGYAMDTKEMFIGGVDGNNPLNFKRSTSINVLNTPNGLETLSLDGSDDRSKLQLMIYSLVDGGEIVFPSGKVVTISSENATYSGMGLILNKDNITFRSDSSAQSEYTFLCDITLDSLFYVPTRINGLELKNISVDCNNKADYGFKTNDVYAAYTYWENVMFTRAKVLNVLINTFVAHFNRCVFASSEQDGIRIEGVGVNVATSVTLTSCYANSNNGKGFDFKNIIYSSLISCACDTSEIGYNFSTAKSVSMVGCGCEGVEKPIIIDGYRGFNINSFYMSTVGVPGSPTPYLIEFQNGLNATISGIEIQNATQGPGEDYLYSLGSTGDSTGGENITVTDWSVTRDKINFVDTYQFDRPIKLLRDDETTKDETVTLNVDDLPDYLSTIEYKEINHDLIIQLNDGVQGDLSIAQKILGLKGSGKLVIQGNVSDRTLTELQGGENRLIVENCSIPVIFKDLTIDNRFSSNFSRLVVATSSKLFFENVLLSNTLASCGAGVDAQKATSIFVDDLTEASGLFEGASAYKFFNVDGTSKVQFAERSAAPTSGWGSIGWKFYNSAPVAGGFIGWVCTTRGTSPVYKGFGSIEV